MQKPTIVLGASPNSDRYSFKAVEFLLNSNHPVYAIGIKNGTINEIPINKDFNELPTNKIHSVSIYLNRENQKKWYEKIIELKPERVIFNPGAENTEFEDLLKLNGIETIEACTLVMIRTGQY